MLIPTIRTSGSIERLRRLVTRPDVRPVALALAVLLVAPLVAFASNSDGTDEPTAVRTLPATPAESVAAVVSEPAAVDTLEALRPPASGIRVALLSSGVDTSVLGEAAAARVTSPWGEGDLVGYGTFVTSILTGLADVEIVSLDVLGPNSKVNPHRLEAALGWTIEQAADLDVVLLAVPPHEVLDPVSHAMDAGTWNEVLAAGADHPVEAGEGSVFGIAFGEAGRVQREGMPADRARAVAAFVEAGERWYALREALRLLAEEGVGVVAPAGDIGPDVQTVLGLANLPEVVAVGGFDGSAPSALSSSGPSIDGSVKPDLIAPTGIAGRLPEGSALARRLLEGELLELLGLGDDADDPSGIRLDSTFTAAAVTAAVMGSLGRQGLRDVARQRGALVAASEPLAGVPVWRQGAGVLRSAPDASIAKSRPLALAHADLGAEPDSGRWSAKVPFSAPVAGALSVELSDFAGVGPDGRTYTRGAESAPPVSVRVTEGGVELRAPVGDDRYEGGLYCGYTTVPVPTTGGGVAPRVVIDGAPRELEHVPTCLVEGTRLRAHGFYIHDMPAEDLTFALLPALPEEASIVEKPFMLLSMDPLKTKLFMKVTGSDGFATFPNVPPGNFLVRLFSDYGSPITQTLTDAVTGEPVVVEADIGGNPSYLNFQALLLSAAGWTERDLEDRFGERNVTLDPPTGTYWVKVGDRRIRVALGFLKDKPGTAVSSHYVDLLSYRDLDFDNLLGPLGPEGVAGLGRAAEAAWAFAQAPGDPDGIVAAFNPAAVTTGEVLGIARYPFNLTTPNYSAHMSLNFAYELKNAAVAAVVQMGGDTEVGMVTPEVSSEPVEGLAVLGPTAGRANFEFHMLPRGVERGVLYLVFLPSPAVQGTLPSLATATIDELSFQMATWQRVEWPGVFVEGHGMGHTFDVFPNYSERQMSAPGCRTVSSGGLAAKVCEDWRVFVHSPGDDAATVGLRDESGTFGHELGAGGLYADPRRGVADFSSELAFVLAGEDVPAEIALTLPSTFRTNGRFWEQLLLGRDILARHPEHIELLIVDNVPGRQSTLASRVQGGVPVAPYLPFVASEQQALIDPPALFSLL